MDPTLLTRVTPPTREQKLVGVLRRTDTRQNYVVGQGGFRIGREKRCDLIIPDPSVSRLHAEISHHGGHYLLRDLGRHATRINGNEISAVHKLRAGDKIQIGSFEFVFSLRPASAEEFLRTNEVTPVRNAVPDAPTLQHVKENSGPRWFAWPLFLAAAGAAAWFLLF